MDIKLLVIGKTDSKSLQELISQYTNRLQHYIRFEICIIPDIKRVKNMTEEQQRTKESAAILDKIHTGDTLFLLDEKGRSFSSLEFANFLQKQMNTGLKHLVFVVGGPYGFSEKLHSRAHGKISLSKLTFSHQMVRLFFVEQLYRGFTILKNEPYHHR
jgi:23S rRNA (pseudouridine1915-N3)-methyltransferase